MQLKVAIITVSSSAERIYSFYGLVGQAKQPELSFQLKSFLLELICLILHSTTNSGADCGKNEEKDKAAPQQEANSFN